LIESLLGRTQARDFLKKHDKNHLAKETLNVAVSHSAITEIDQILCKFTNLYSTIDPSSQSQTVQLYFYFKKICSLLFYAPELFTHLLVKNFELNGTQMTLVDIVIDTLKHTLVFFCEFFIISLKINAGFCTKSELATFIESTSTENQI
jgi:hypothetical protein